MQGPVSCRPTKNVPTIEKGPRWTEWAECRVIYFLKDYPHGFERLLRRKRLCGDYHIMFKGKRKAVSLIGEADIF